MKKSYSVVITTLFLLFLGLMSGGTLWRQVTAPEKEFSPLENRYLASPPPLSLETVSDGRFMKGAERFINDHVVGRDIWVGMKAWSERISGKKENNGVYFGRENTLIRQMEPPDWNILEKNIGFVNQLVDNVDIPVYFGLIPTSAAIWRDRLPFGAPVADEQEIIDTLYDMVQTHTIDLYGTLWANRQEALYYRTDHHWTSLGAYYGYAAWMEALGQEANPLPIEEKVTVSNSFYGTLFSSSGVRWVPPDEIDRYISQEGVTVTAYPQGQPEEGSLYVDSFLQEKDQYSSFLGGNKPLCVIQTEHQEEPKLLLIRDSYADSLAPFLTQNFSEIHLFDPRYNLTSVREYIAEHEIDVAVVLYSIPNFLAADRLFVLGR